VALTLRMVAGLTVPEIARAFLVPQTAMEQRITRAKAKIKAARIPYRVPSAKDLPARISGVLAVLFLVFNEGVRQSHRPGGQHRRDRLPDPPAATSWGNTSADQAGCHSSIRLPSGSVTQPNRPTPSISCVSVVTSAPLARNCASIASRSLTRKLSMVCWARDPK
jgi:Sigma-70, region 4